MPADESRRSCDADAHVWDTLQVSGGFVNLIAKAWRHSTFGPLMNPAPDEPTANPVAGIPDDFATLRVASPAPVEMSATPPTHASVMGANPDSTVPFVFGRRIAKGGMGAILEGDDCKLGRKIAVKVMLDANASAEQTQRFVQEAAVLGRLEHPNIVPIHDLGRDSVGALYYTMKLVKGVTLQHILDDLRKEKPEALAHYTLDRLLTIFRKVCDALAFAHANQIIHRDLKPENIMVGEFGEVLVMDWGIAKILGDPRSGDLQSPSVDPLAVENRHSLGTDSLTATLDGAVMGTPNYMSPEQAMGKVNEMDPRSDIFSLGGILYCILTLRPPVEGKDVWEVLEKVQMANITAPTTFGVTGKSKPMAKGEVLEAQKIKPLPHVPAGRVPPALSAVAMKALTLDKTRRYQGIAAFSADIEKYQGGFATSAENAGLGRQMLLAVKRHKAASIGLAAVLVVGSVLGTKVFLEGRRAERALTDLKASAPSLLALAESEAGFQRFDSALVKLDAALALDPALSAGWWRRVWLLLGMGRYGEAPAAFRTAQQRDPAQHAHDALLPVLDAIAAAPDDATRFPPERTEALFRHFTQVGASGELNALSQRLTLGAKQKEQMVRQRLDEWLGKGVGTVKVQSDGTIELSNLPKATDTLEPLRGLPIESIDVSSTAVKSLEPLHGMALTKISMHGTRISDLSPLRGMPITQLLASGTDISDLTPLAGMPLRYFGAPTTKISDISPLRGAPLEGIYLLTNHIVDFSPLHGAPLKTVSMGLNQCSDLSFLTDSPAVEHLDCNQNSIADLSPLRGKPLKFLAAGRNRITDLRPLAGLPLTELKIDNNPIADYAPLRELRQLQKLRISELKDIKVTLEPLRQHPSLQYIAVGTDGPSRPVAEFWADYDAQQAAGKK